MNPIAEKSSGLILQWGVIFNTAFTHFNYHTVTFPIVFPNTVMNVTGQIALSSAVDGVYSVYLSQMTPSGGIFISDNSTVLSTSGNLYWSSIGY